MKVWCFGSSVEGDDLAWRVGKELGLKCTGNVHDLESGDVVVDVVRGLEEIRFVRLDELVSDKSLSVHDFDLGTYLRLMKGILKVRVIGIPWDYPLKRAVSRVKSLLNLV